MADYPGTPRWVRYLFVGTMALLALGFLATLLAGVDHGPGMH